MSKSRRPNSLQASLSLQAGDQTSLSESQLELLEAIAESGSISAAARQVGVSYKTAWDRIDRMNNLSDRPLVERSSGGRHGGGTRLTEAGHALISGFRALQQAHDNYLSRLDDGISKMSDVARFVKNSSLLTSARNQYRGRIINLSRGGVNTEVEIALGDSVSLHALVTNESRRLMGLKKGLELVALVKASWVLLARDGELLTSARNRLSGSISSIRKGSVNSEVILDIGEGKTVCAIVTNASVAALKLKKGDMLSALFKASSVILMRD